MSEEEMISRQELQYAVKNVGSFDFGDFNHETITSVLNLIEKQDKMIDLMAQTLLNYGFVLIKSKNGLKEYFRKKVENEK